MKIVIAPDSYKESLSALEVATAIEQGFREIWPDADYVKIPVADGGEGTGTRAVWMRGMPGSIACSQRAAKMCLRPPRRPAMT